MWHFNVDASAGTAIVLHEPCSGNFFAEDVLVAMHSVEGSCTLPLADACHMLETMHDTHVHTALPAIVDTDASLQSLMQRCLECKVGREREGEGLGV